MGINVQREGTLYGLSSAPRLCSQSLSALDRIRAHSVDRKCARHARAGNRTQKIHPGAVIEELTSLPKRGRIGWRSVGVKPPEEQEMRAALDQDRRVRLEGGRNVHNAARSAGVKRYIVQSTGFFYAPGPGLATETDSLAFDSTHAISSGARTYQEIEERVLSPGGPEGVVLRYGFFYGPGTWFNKNGDIVNQLRERQCPMVGAGQAVWSWIHIDDAAAATVTALQCAPGIYNIVDDDPSEFSVWLPVYAGAVGAPDPPHLTQADALQQLGPDFVYYATRLRGASNAKAKHELGFTPRRLE